MPHIGNNCPTCDQRFKKVGDALVATLLALEELARGGAAGPLDRYRALQEARGKVLELLELGV